MARQEEEQAGGGQTGAASLWGAGEKGVGGASPLGNLESFMQQAGELQDWVRVHGVLKGTNLFCYRQPEDTDTGEEPLFTIGINKVMSPWW